jgi:predicted nucleic acid-binding protein
LKQAYVDTSWLVAIAFAEKGSEQATKLLGSDLRVVASNLLEAELRSAFLRENVQENPGSILEGIGWILPDRSLAPELGRVFESGVLKGADAWHLACALYLDPDASTLAFLTRDIPQRRVARALGFATP